jgi:ABC-2 type transport system permease protein
MSSVRYKLRLYFRLIGAHLRSEMQYRASFLGELVGDLLITALDLVALTVLLNRFTAVGGWTLPEVMFLYGTGSAALGLAELFAGGFDGFEEWVVRGEFDRLLIRPLSIEFQMIAGAFPLRRLGRVAQGVLALILALMLLRPEWNAGKWGFLLVTIAGGMLMFMAILIVGATAAFWTPQTAEITNIFSYGGQFMTSYPMHIYQAWLRSIFTFVIPMAFITFYPALYLLDKPDPWGLPSWIAFLSPVVAMAAFRGALSLWRAGVRHYQSTGS